MKYRTGTRAQLIQRMAYYAIRDQESLIDSHVSTSGEIMPGYEDLVEEVEETIKDIKQLSKALN